MARHPRRRERCQQRYRGRNKKTCLDGSRGERVHDPEPRSRVSGGWEVTNKSLKGPQASLPFMPPLVATRRV